MTSYHFREAKGADANAPLFFVFHGTGADENQFFDLATQLLPGAHVIAPRGDVSEGGALRYFRRTGEGRYDMEDLARRTEAMGQFLHSHVEAANPSAVIGLGYSNGANILASVMFAQPQLFDAAVLFHPLIPFDPPASIGIEDRRVLVTGGRRDPICPPEGTQRLADYFAKEGANLQLTWHEGGHELRQEELLAAQQFLTPYRVRTA